MQLRRLPFPFRKYATALHPRSARTQEEGARDVICPACFEDLLTSFDKVLWRRLLQQSSTDVSSSSYASNVVPVLLLLHALKSTVHVLGTKQRALQHVH